MCILALFYVQNENITLILNQNEQHISQHTNNYMKPQLFVSAALVLLSALPGALSAEEAQVPENDSCSSATVFSTLPSKEVQIGSVAGATEDEWSLDPSCGFLQVSPGKGVWYTIKGVKEGTNLTVICSNMDCMLLTTNATLGECPSTFLCADASVGDVNMELAYKFTTEEGGIYYIYIAPKFEIPGPEYTVTVEETPYIPPTLAPTIIEFSAPSGAVGTCLGALFNVALFAAMYFLI